MKKDSYDVGDIVQIKTVSEIENEFGRGVASINLNGWNKAMDGLYKRPQVIDTKEGNYYILKAEEGKTSRWWVCNDVIRGLWENKDNIYSLTQELKRAEKSLQETKSSIIDIKGRIDKVKKYYTPELGDTFYYNSYGLVERKVWSNSKRDNHNYSIGNCYRTYEECLRDINYQKTENKLIKVIRDINGVWEPDWNNINQNKYLLYADPNIFSVRDSMYKQTKIVANKFYCKRSFVELAINIIGEDRLYKYLMR